MAGKAGVAKLVDVPDLGSGAARHGGSSPSARTNIQVIWLAVDLWISIRDLANF